MEEEHSMEGKRSMEEKHSMKRAVLSENEFVQRQREDAWKQYERIREQIKIPILPDKKHMVALLLSAAAVIGLGIIPSPVREQAEIRHQVQGQAKEEQKTLDELLEALEGVDMESLTEEQKTQLKELQEAMKLSKEELAKAGSWESLASALEKLDYKYEQTGQSLDRLASQLEHPETAGVAAAQAMAKAAANQNGSQAASGMTASANQPSGEGNDSGSAGENDGSGQGNGSDSESGNQSGNGEGSGNGSQSGNGEGSGNGSQSGNGEGSGNGSQSGSGDGEGSGSGGGEGSGSGNGGNGSGQGGNGRGTGSSTAVHDYVSVPNGVGNDSSLTGNKNGDQDSEYFRQQNGLAWEGEHVDYNSVIGEYTDNAYEGIASNRYPSGMESVIRDYFETLNQ